MRVASMSWRGWVGGGTSQRDEPGILSVGVTCKKKVEVLECIDGSLVSDLGGEFCGMVCGGVVWGMELNGVWPSCGLWRHDAETGGTLCVSAGPDREGGSRQGGIGVLTCGSENIPRSTLNDDVGGRLAPTPSFWSTHRQSEHGIFLSFTIYLGLLTRRSVGWLLCKLVASIRVPPALSAPNLAFLSASLHTGLCSSIPGSLEFFSPTSKSVAERVDGVSLAGDSA